MTYFEKNFSIAPNLASLASMNGHTDGQVAFVESVKGNFIYSTSSTRTADGRTVLNTPNGGSTRWLFDYSFLHPDWQQFISDIYVNDSAGTSENKGIYSTPTGSPAPITSQELRLRWGDKPTLRTSDPGFTVTIHILSTIAPPNRLDLSFFADTDSFISVLGENTTILRSGSLDVSGGFTAWNPSGASGGSPNIIKDTTLANWTPYIGKRIHFTAVNSYAYILKDLGGHQARISVPQFSDVSAFNPIPTNIFPSNGAAYQIEDPVRVSLGRTDFDTVADQAGTFGVFTQTNISNITFTANPNNNTTIFTSNYLNDISLYQCVFDSFYLNSSGCPLVVFGNCRVWALTEAANSGNEAGGMGFCGGAIIKPGQDLAITVTGGLGDAGVLDYYTTVQQGYVVVHGDTNIRSFSVWDAPSFADNPNGHAILLGTPGHHATASGVRMSDRANIPIFGSGGAGVGLFVGQLTRALWEKLPNIIGTAGDFKLGTGGKARFFNEGTGTYSNIITETWAHLNTAQPTGFGAGAHNLTDDSRLIVSVSA